MLPYQNLSLQDMPGEVWKDIPGYENLYQISNRGRAKSLSHNVRCRNGKTRISPGKILRQLCLDDRPYLSFNVSKQNTIKRIYTHRIVAQLFINNPEHKQCVDHIDTNTRNNDYTNLRWATFQENASNPLTKQHISAVKSGTNCFFYGKVFGNKPIICIKPDGTIIRYNSIKEAERAGYNYRGIQECLYGHYSKHKGCIWKYDV